MFSLLYIQCLPTKSFKVHLDSRSALRGYSKSRILNLNKSKCWPLSYIFGSWPRNHKTFLLISGKTVIYFLVIKANLNFTRKKYVRFLKNLKDLDNIPEDFLFQVNLECRKPNFFINYFTYVFNLQITKYLFRELSKLLTKEKNHLPLIPGRTLARRLLN